MKMSDIILQMKEQEKVLELKARRRRATMDISAKKFKEVFILHANQVLLKRRITSPFVIDESNRAILNELYYYAIGWDMYSGDLSKGLLLIGNFGVGKTIILTAFVNMFKDLIKKEFRTYHAKDLANEIINERGISDILKRCPLFIDDLGKEVKSALQYGTEIKPMVDLFSLRYDYGSWTMATANNTLESFREFYGQTISERMIEMFNIHTLTGESRRK